MVEAVGLQVFRQIGIDQPDLAAFFSGVRFSDVSLAFAQRLDLGAGQNQPRFECIDDLVVETSLAVFRHIASPRLCAAFCHCRIFLVQETCVAQGRINGIAGRLLDRDKRQALGFAHVA